MAMRRSHNLHTIYKVEVTEHPLPPEMGVDLTCANTVIYEMSKLCIAMHGSNFAVILIYLYLNF